MKGVAIPCLWRRRQVASLWAKTWSLSSRESIQQSDCQVLSIRSPKWRGATSWLDRFFGLNLRTFKCTAQKLDENWIFFGDLGRFPCQSKIYGSLSFSMATCVKCSEVCCHCWSLLHLPMICWSQEPHFKFGLMMISVRNSFSWILHAGCCLPPHFMILCSQNNSNLRFAMKTAKNLLIFQSPGLVPRKQVEIKMKLITDLIIKFWWNEIVFACFRAFGQTEFNTYQRITRPEIMPSLQFYPHSSQEI